jgi:hypothetical protein
MFATTKTLWNMLEVEDIPEVDDSDEDIVDGQPENIAKNGGENLLTRSCRVVNALK